MSQIEGNIISIDEAISSDAEFSQPAVDYEQMPQQVSGSTHGELAEQLAYARSERIRIKRLIDTGEQNWRVSAECQDYDPELWFSENDAEANKEAKLICRGCLVAAYCLGLAIDEKIDHGIWGGVTTRERRRMRRDRTRTTPAGVTAKSPPRLF